VGIVLASRATGNRRPCVGFRRDHVGSARWSVSLRGAAVPRRLRANRRRLLPLPPLPAVQWRASPRLAHGPLLGFRVPEGFTRRLSVQLPQSKGVLRRLRHANRLPSLGVPANRGRDPGESSRPLQGFA
jgi:hypothetical protein